jgi:hypothetical protein
MKQILLISWIAIRELVYEKVFYLLFSFVGLALVLDSRLYVGVCSNFHGALLDIHGD